MNVPWYQRVTLTLLRVMAPFVIMEHGAQKLFGVLGGFGGPGHTAHLFSLMGLAGVIEFFVALLVMIGLFTRIAALIVSGEMAVAYFYVHRPQGFWPIRNHGELAVLFCFIFLSLAATGGGPYSLDALLFRTRGGEATGPGVAAS